MLNRVESISVSKEQETIERLKASLAVIEKEYKVLDEELEDEKTCDSYSPLYRQLLVDAHFNLLNLRFFFQERIECLEDGTYLNKGKE